MAGWHTFEGFDFLNGITNEASPFAAVFDGWESMLPKASGLGFFIPILYTPARCLSLQKAQSSKLKTQQAASRLQILDGVGDILAGGHLGD